MRGVQSRVSELFKLTEQDCELSITPMPSRSAGPIYIAVHGIRSRAYEHNDDQIHESYALNVTVSLRSRGISQDRVPQKLLSGDAGLLRMADRLKTVLHNDYETIRLANALISGSDCGFYRSLSFQFQEPITERPPSWWGAKDGAASAGISVTLSFGEARINRDSSSFRLLS